MLASFQVEDKNERVYFFQKIFPLANTTIQMVSKIFFLIFSKVEVNFADRKFI